MTSKTTACTSTALLNVLADVCSTVDGCEALVRMMQHDGATRVGETPQHFDEVMADDINTQQRGGISNGTQGLGGDVSAHAIGQPVEILDGVEYYRVESIIGHMKCGKSMRFLVRWGGYSPDHDSWEPRKSLAHLDIFKLYERIHVPQCMRG
jgi:hypothetical protein